MSAALAQIIFVCVVDVVALVFLIHKIKQYWR